MGRYFGRQPRYSREEAEAQAQAAIDAAAKKGRPPAEDWKPLASRMGDIHRELANRPPVDLPAPPTGPPAVRRRPVNQILRPAPAPQPVEAPAPAAPAPRPAAKSPAKRAARAAAPVAKSPAKRATPAAAPAADTPTKRAPRATASAADVPVKRAKRAAAPSAAAPAPARKRPPAKKRSN